MSAIAKNSSITLITGVPGNGKSLRAVWYMREAAKAGEQVFASNFNGLSVEGVMEFDDPTKWEELPAGSILVVDEAQKFWRAGVTETTREDGKDKKIVPLNIQAMETIRHGGIRIIMLTQSPALIHTNVRALVGLHEHLVRENGKDLATVYRRSRVIDNVRSEKALLAEDHESWPYPKECYGLYKSAEVHTVKRTISSKNRRGMIMAVVALVILGFAVYKVKSLTGDDTDAQAKGVIATAQAGASTPLASKEKEDKVVWDSPTAYAVAHLPRFGTMPWTAEIFDQRTVTADPQLLCMSSMPGEGGDGEYLSEPSCTCLTEQGTTYDISQPECRTLARRGPVYNPYKQQRVDPGVQGQAPAAMAQSAASSSGSVVASDANRPEIFPRSEGYQPGGTR